jgi:hypothetical protein
MTKRTATNTMTTRATMRMAVMDQVFPLEAIVTPEP